MSQCWPEGVLRAHLDRELSPEEMDGVAAHLGECQECARLSAELVARAKRVGVWMEALPAAAPLTGVEWVAPARRRAAGGRWWIGLAAALAAAAVVASLMMSRHKDVVPVSAPVVASAPPAIESPAIESPVVVAPPTQTAAAPRRVRRPKAPVRVASNEFLALDDEPIETGVVMRVGVEPGNVQADVLFGPDGRAHAIRLVSSRQ